MKKIIGLFLFIFFVFPLCSCEVGSDGDVDRINYYEIKIDQREDGTLDMTYTIEWEVLSNSEGPLKWVKIGIPNKYIDSIQNLSDECSKVYYYDDDGEFIRCNLKNSISKGEIANFKFSFHATALYTFDDVKIYYEFIPGWFDEIEVSEIRVLWNNTNVVTSNSNSGTYGDYYVWRYKLDKGESIRVKVDYNRSDYPNLITEGDYKAYQNDLKRDKYVGISVFIVVVVFFIIVIIAIIIHKNSSDKYYTYRGFYRGHRYNWFHRHFLYNHGYDRKGKELKNPTIINSSKGSSGRSCACACACACAGGGRAGCSRKDFYRPKVKTDDLERILSCIKK